MREGGRRSFLSSYREGRWEEEHKKGHKKAFPDETVGEGERPFFAEVAFTYKLGH